MFPVTGFQLPGKNSETLIIGIMIDIQGPVTGNWRLVTLQPVTDD